RYSKAVRLEHSERYPCIRLRRQRYLYGCGSIRSTWRGTAARDGDYFPARKCRRHDRLDRSQYYPSPRRARMEQNILVPEIVERLQNRRRLPSSRKAAWPRQEGLI